MKLEFDSLDQLADFAYFYSLGVSSFRRAQDQMASTPTEGSTSPTKGGRQPEAAVAAILEPIPGDAADAADIAELYADHPELQDGEQVVIDAGGATVTFDKVTIPEEKTETPTEAPKRKRRTKAEIAADEAAAKAATPGEGNEPLTYSDPGSEDAVAEVAAIANQVATTAASIASDAEAKVQAARAVYTPELVETLRGHAELFDANRTEHLKEARDAISKKGFIPYNATMHGLGLGASIASYSDDEVKLHRAAIAHLLAS